jgi:hypothetical protein
MDQQSHEYWISNRGIHDKVHREIYGVAEVMNSIFHIAGLGCQASVGARFDSYTDRQMCEQSMPRERRGVQHEQHQGIRYDDTSATIEIQ